MFLADVLRDRESERLAELERQRHLIDFISRAFAPIPNRQRFPIIEPEALTHQEFPPGRGGRFSF